MNTKLNHVEAKSVIAYSRDRKIKRGDQVLSLKPKQMTDDEIVQKLKQVLNECDAIELKTKKFVGLLNDFIPYNNGLKIRLELLGKGGYIERLQKLSIEANNQAKIEKLALGFTKEYGFIYDETLETFELLIRAMAFKATKLNNSGLKIVSSVQNAQGNFSKKHLANEMPRSVVTSDLTLEKSQSHNINNKTPQPTKQLRKRKFVRNKMNLGLYLMLLLAIPVGYYIVQSKFGNVKEIMAILNQYFTWPIYNNSNTITIFSIIAVVSIVPFIAKRFFKLNILGFYPLIMLLIQVVLITVQPRVPELYLYLQLILGVIVFISYAILGFYSMRLPKGAREYTASRAIIPYYLVTGIWFVSQYIVLTKV
ncbi:hypothetical protein QE109_06180 [Fusibacter bizertensis]|uniref:PDZ domain-containing protein n=1 Tax=Fusibacter bizertensis TaxID=1488331 RepID=A0ABT6NBG4_9FIRM|nr:hypothetical protein [Fusibacter bizertensis]MDH8677725.1 hypothetical protein [Fusibacter bizertensis]